jgi:release factor glutamine methyltransferase
MVRNETGGARELIDVAAEALRCAGVGTPRLDAEVMLAEAIGRSRIDVMFGAAEIDESGRSRFAMMIDRRARREPLAYIMGRKEFYSIDLEVTPAVLIPRPETEVVVATALEFLGERPRARVLDLGAGSGAIALAIAANAKQVEVVASDVSIAALEVARRNSDRLALRDHVRFRQADCFDPIDGDGPLGRFDLIVSNPPYVRDDELAALQPEIARWEPRSALAGGPDGLNFYRRIVSGCRQCLEAEGCVVLEIGDAQADTVMRIFRDSGFTAIRAIPDLGSAPRVISAKRP